MPSLVSLLQLALVIHSTGSEAAPCTQNTGGASCWLDTTCEPLNAKCVWGEGDWEGTCKCREGDCFINPTCTPAPTAAPTTNAPTAPTAAPTANSVSLAWLDPIAAQGIEYLLNSYLTTAALCGTVFDPDKPCSVQLRKNASCNGVDVGTLAVATDNSVAQLNVAGLSASCALEVDISGTVKDVSIVSLDDFTLTAIDVEISSLSWGVYLNFTDDFPSGATSQVSSPSCFSGSVSIGAKNWKDKIEAEMVNAALALVLPALMCTTAPQALIDEQLNAWLRNTSQAVLEADASEPSRSLSLDGGVHSWIDDPFLDVLRDLTVYLNSPNASNWETPLLAKLSKPVVLSLEDEIVHNVSFAGLESFRILNISSTSDPQVLRVELELVNVTATVLGTGFAATAVVAPLLLDVEALIALNQSKLDQVQLFNTTLWGLENCWPDAIGSLAITKLNMSYSDMQLAVSITANRNFDANFQEFVLAPLEQAFGGSFDHLVERISQGPLRVGLNQGIQSWLNLTIAQCNSNCTFSGQTTCATLDDTQCRCDFMFACDTHCVVWQSPLSVLPSNRYEGMMLCCGYCPIIVALVARGPAHLLFPGCLSPTHNPHNSTQPQLLHYNTQQHTTTHNPYTNIHTIAHVRSACSPV